uniref:acetylcholinesterase n=1 Tax=Caligus rogercresseyi TaxID=217165 RepID=A0A345DGH5_CALRO|nr:acetylcholinesterase 1b [Caligus rogercresseyi]
MIYFIYSYYFPITFRNVISWLGIPYASPPIGNLRFRHPRPMQPWDGIRNATQPPNSCVQIDDTMFPGFDGTEKWNANTPISEDCLYLSVTAPEIPKQDKQRLPVLVWIHGGGFFSGTTTLDVYDPRTLVSEEEILFVGIQYRLGSLGFLFADSHEAPGNAGLFDQLMALVWVKENIIEFGGDPERITIAGGTAGAASVGFHLLSPLSNTYFSQAIMQSSSALVPWGLLSKKEASARSKDLAGIARCPIDDLSLMIDCLRGLKATQIMYLEWESPRLRIMDIPFVPVLDGIFIPDNPREALHLGGYKKVNILIGTNEDDGQPDMFYNLPDLFKMSENVSIGDEYFTKAVNELNPYVNEVGRNAIIFEYIDWSRPRSPILNRDALTEMMSDHQFTCPTIDFAHGLTGGENKVFMYKFNHRSSRNPWPVWSGVIQGEEIPFVFGDPLNRSKSYMESEIELSKRMMRYWSNFVRAGDPNLSLVATETRWPEYNPIQRRVLELQAGNNSISEGLDLRKCEFWSRYLPNLLSSTTKSLVNNVSLSLEENLEPSKNKGLWNFFTGELFF